MKMYNYIFFLLEISKFQKVFLGATASLQNGTVVNLRSQRTTSYQLPIYEVSFIEWVDGKLFKAFLGWGLSSIGLTIP